MKPAEITREGVGGGEPVCGLLRACPLVDEMGMLLLEKEAIVYFFTVDARAKDNYVPVPGYATTVTKNTQRRNLKLFGSTDRAIFSRLSSSRH